MKDELEKQIMKIMREKLVSHKPEVLKQISEKKNNKLSIDKTLEILVEKKWIAPLYGSNTTFAITQKGMKESKRK